jgi:hypothetical protein
MALRTGSIVSHRYRKSALYLVIVVGPDIYHLVRVKKQKGYPVSAIGRYVERDASALTEVDYAPEHASMNRESAKRSNYKPSQLNILPPCQTKDQIPIDIYEQFYALLWQLSPENLTCDGELSRSQVQSRYNQLKRHWAQLEAQIGLSVSENLIWDIHLQNRVH